MLSLGFSPCPNDTFIFDALVHGAVDMGEDLQFNPQLEDVETLNAWALAGRLDVTKVSYAILAAISDEYALLQSGSALGRGVGPLLLAAGPRPTDDIANWRIAIPGKNTTANMLLSLAFPQAQNKTEVLFSKIEEAVLAGAYDAGLVIHESRFTYAARGLHKLLDLGSWWEKETGAPIPLGAIVARRSLGKDRILRIDKALQSSIELAWKDYPKISNYVRLHAQEMDVDVMRKHIELYVNQYTTRLDSEALSAIEHLAKAGGKTVSDFFAR